MLNLRYMAIRNSARVRQRLLGLKSGTNAARQVVIVHSADRVETSEAICLPGEFDRASAVISSSNMEKQRKWAAAGILEHGPTLAYRVDNAFIAGDEVYTSNSFDRYGRIVPPFAPSGVVSINEGMLCESGGAHFFGHWLGDNLCTELLSAEMDKPPLSLAPRWMHESGYRSVTQLAAVHFPVVAVKTLWLVDDRSYNASRITRFKHLRGLVRRAVPEAASAMVYIARGSSGTARNLTNDHEVRDALQSRGFIILEPEHASPQQIIDTLSKASFVVSVEGSAISHALVSLPAKAGMVIIQPPGRFNIFHKVIGDFAEFKTGFIVASPAENGFSVNVTNLLKTIDLVMHNSL
jgi:hypothetical protein